MIENLGETLEAVLTPVIQRAVIYRGRKMYIKLGDSEVEFHPDFRWVHRAPCTVLRQQKEYVAFDAAFGRQSALF